MKMQPIARHHAYLRLLPHLLPWSKPAPVIGRIAVDAVLTEQAQRPRNNRAAARKTPHENVKANHDLFASLLGKFVWIHGHDHGQRNADLPEHERGFARATRDGLEHAPAAGGRAECKTVHDCDGRSRGGSRTTKGTAHQRECETRAFCHVRNMGKCAINVPYAFVM